MFIEKVQENNRALIEFAFHLHQKGLILPDTYVLDYDTIMENGRKMKEIADPLGVKLFFMLKQLGRNPEIAKGLQKLGFDGVVAVDFKETLVMLKNHIKLGNVGHLVQIPKACIKEVVAARPTVMTVYSYEKILEINQAAQEMDMIQPIMLRISDSDSEFYSGQVGGFMVDELEALIDRIEMLKHVRIGGLTIFPALLYDESKNEIAPTANYHALKRGRLLLEKRGYHDLLINLPSATCMASIPLIHELGGNNGEPGHGLTGTTPFHKNNDGYERTGYVYVSEISHNYLDKAYCYGGGHYRRGHLKYALVGHSADDLKLTKAYAVHDDSIDYHFELDGRFDVGDTVLMCFRAQMFTTRSHIAVVKGLKDHRPELFGIYDAYGHMLKKGETNEG